MYVRGDQWPVFIYEDNQFDPENPWKGLLRSQLLCRAFLYAINMFLSLVMYLQAYKHIFTSPSSVDHDDLKATRSGNAHIHGMTCVTTASLAYVATQVTNRPTKAV
jgi:hypothetical protein